MYISPFGSDAAPKRKGYSSSQNLVAIEAASQGPPKRRWRPDFLRIAANPSLPAAASRPWRTFSRPQCAFDRPHYPLPQCVCDEAGCVSARLHFLGCFPATPTRQLPYTGSRRVVFVCHEHVALVKILMHALVQKLYFLRARHSDTLSMKHHIAHSGYSRITKTCYKYRPRCRTARAFRGMWASEPRCIHRTGPPAARTAPCSAALARAAAPAPAAGPAWQGGKRNNGRN